MEGVLTLQLQSTASDYTKLKHKPILQCKYATPIQGYTGEYKYKLQVSDYQVET